MRVSLLGICASYDDASFATDGFYRCPRRNAVLYDTDDIASSHRDSTSTQIYSPISNSIFTSGISSLDTSQDSCLRKKCRSTFPNALSFWDTSLMGRRWGYPLGNHRMSTCWAVWFPLCRDVWLSRWHDIFSYKTTFLPWKNENNARGATDFYRDLCRLDSSNCLITEAFSEQKLYHNIQYKTHKTQRSEIICKWEKRRVLCVICLPKLPQILIRWIILFKRFRNLSIMQRNLSDMQKTS